MRNVYSPNSGPRRGNTPVDMLVFHYTGMQTAQSAINRLCDPASNVSAHYCIDENGLIFSLVDEDKRAWHAGQSYWRGETDINSRSIGIEIVNPGHHFGYCSFPEGQMNSVVNLSKDILSRFSIPAWNVVGHSDIAPDRKLDPGEFFDWKKLAAAGVGVWPTPRATKQCNLKLMLATYGYDSEACNTIAAFQRHFRPSAITGKADEESCRIAAGLLKMVTKF